jgi:hypothetical protein
LGSPLYGFGWVFFSVDKHVSNMLYSSISEEHPKPKEDHKRITTCHQNVKAIFVGLLDIGTDVQIWFSVEVPVFSRTGYIHLQSKKSLFDPKYGSSKFPPNVTVSLPKAIVASYQTIYLVNRNCHAKSMLCNYPLTLEYGTNTLSWSDDNSLVVPSPLFYILTYLLHGAESFLRS